MQEAAPRSPERFAFGQNWRRFIDDVDDGRIQEAEGSLSSMLGLTDLRGRSFLDIGSGSGLFSLAAARLGAGPVLSIDYDAESVATTREIKRRFLPEADWAIERGDVTDGSFLARIGTYDVVYAWGVLHHTGAIWHALDNTCRRVGEGGILFVSIYNDQGRKSRAWRRVKQRYNRLPQLLRPPFAVAVMLPFELRSFTGALIRCNPGKYVREWTQPRRRGMSRWHDLLDWVGGYPFEVARPEEVFEFCRDRGFELLRLQTCGGSSGNNQFVFRRREPIP